MLTFWDIGLGEVGGVIASAGVVTAAAAAVTAVAAWVPWAESLDATRQKVSASQNT